MRRLMLMCSLLMAGAVWAQEAPVAPQVPPPPPLPDKATEGEQIEPTVTIRRDKEGVVEEYRENGRLVMVKITPAVGPAYYMVDQDGDGQLENADPELGDKVRPVYYTLKEW